MEIWNLHPRFPSYAVSSEGRVRRVEPDIKGRLRGRPLTPWKKSNGYLSVVLALTGGPQAHYVHRLVCEAFHGPAPEGKTDVAHSDGTRTNNAPGNLRWASRKENMRDALGHGTVARGVRIKNSVLDDEQVRLIRSDCRSQREISEVFGVSQSLISMVKNRKIWTHVEDFAPENF